MEITEHVLKSSDAVFTRDTFTWGKCISQQQNVMQYNRNVNLPQVNVSRVNTAWEYLNYTQEPNN